MRRLLAKLVAAWRAWLSRRAARQLLAERPPRGLPPGAAPPLALRPPASAREDGFFTVPLVADALRGRRPGRILRLVALPPETPELGVAQPRHFRLDPRTLTPANESILPLERRDPSYRWVLPALRAALLDTRWMARERIAFLAPLQPEWFSMWWEARRTERPGAREPRDRVVPPEIDWAMEDVKEQMLLRRDVKKDEQPPEPAEMAAAAQLGQPIAAHRSENLAELIPAKEWPERAVPSPAPVRTGAPREAYLEWRTLLSALEER